MPVRNDRFEVRGKRGITEVLRHIWRGVWQLLGSGETVSHRFFFGYFGQFMKHIGYSQGAA